MTQTLPSGPPSLLRRLNSAAVLQAIRTAGPVSRSEVARATGLSKPTVNELVELLLHSGHVRESLGEDEDRPRRPGPRARLLAFRADLGHVLGIDIGANKILALASDLDGNVVAAERRRTTARERRSPDALLDGIKEAAGRALAAGGVPEQSLKVVGVGTPGLVDPASGGVTLAPQIGGLEGIQLGPRLESSFPCAVIVDNEVRLSLLAERWRGAARGIEDVFYVQIGVGIGGGILIGGEIYRGADGAAGEIGYLPVFEGEEARDGLGSFEHAAGGTAFARLGRRAVETGDGHAMLALAGGDVDAIDAEVVFAAAAGGDSAAQAILTELLERIARGISAAIVVLNPSTVVVGGGVSRAGTALLEPLERRVRELVPVPPRLVLSSLGDEAVALGAVKLALQAVDERLLDLATAASA